MRIQFKSRTLLVVVFIFAVLCAARSRSAANADRFIKSIGESPRLVAGVTMADDVIDNDTKARLLSDAKLPSSRYSLRTGFLQHPKVALMPRSVADYLLMRSTYRVEFKTWDLDRKPNPAVGTKLFHNRHESDYQIDVFGVNFVQSAKNPR